MAIAPEHFLEKVKSSLDILGDDDDNAILQFIAAAISQLRVSGVSDKIIENDPLSVIAISIFVSHLRRQDPAPEFSQAYMSIVNDLFNASISGMTDNEIESHLESLNCGVCKL